MHNSELYKRENKGHFEKEQNYIGTVKQVARTRGIKK
jgi:hypothetical protein